MKKKKAMRRISRRMYLVGAVCTFLIAVVLAGVWLVASRAQSRQLPAAGPLSRQIMAYAEQEVIVQREAPPIAALHYAYIASAYEDALTKSDQAGGLYAAEQLMQDVYTFDSAAIEAKFNDLAKANGVAANTVATAPASVKNVVAVYEDRYRTDGHDLAWDGVIPSGPGKWVSKTGQPPTTPRAGDWKRWVVTTAITAPAPPVLGSAEDIKQLNIVRQAVANRNGEDVQEINLWAGSVGTETPAGLWQNQLFSTVHKDLPADALQADKSYALIQKNVAQTMSDAFMECWKVKYIYWTARPDMRIPDFNTAMPDPNFPGYISGHSTVSKAAADVLSVMVPRYKDNWETMADTARRSRLVAGIHFDIDNSVGYIVGSDVASQAVSTLHLQQVL